MVYNKIILILLMFSFIFVQEPCEGTCLSEEETKNMTNNIKELQFDLEKYKKLTLNLEDQIKIYSKKDSLNTSQIEDYMRLIKLKDEMIKVVKPKWYENKWIWFGLGVIATAGSVKLAGEIVD
tara:strand:- start:354 stop:722 length:369 start_codon:yes stop_codon:yes gene_type:complete